MTSLARDMDAARPGVRLAETLCWILLPLALLASLSGLLIPGLYREPAVMLPALRGQDLITVLVLLALAAALTAARRDSARATLVWLGLLGYVFYTYTGAAFGYAFNPLFLLYVGLSSLSGFALVSTVASLNLTELQRRFDASSPRGPVAVFLLLLAALLSVLWLAQIAPFYTSGTLPELIVRSGGVTSYVFVLDLGLIVPLAVLSALWLWRRHPAGSLGAGYLLIKAATMGLALLMMNLFAARAGLQVDPPELLAFYSLLAVGGLGLSVWFLRHCHGEVMGRDVERGVNSEVRPPPGGPA